MFIYFLPYVLKKYRVCGFLLHSNIHPIPYSRALDAWQIEDSQYICMCKLVCVGMCVYTYLNILSPFITWKCNFKKSDSQL